MSEDTKSILVIGSISHKGATKCIKWGDLVYVGDYDFLIVDTTSLTKDVLQEILEDDGAYFGKLRKDIVDVQQNRGIAITCILSPYIFSQSIESSEDDVDDLLRKISNNYSWSPIIPILERIPAGQKLNLNKSDLPKDYLNKIKEYDLLYERSVNNTSFVDKSKDGNIYTKCYFRSLLQNNVGRDVAFEVTWKVHQYSDYTVIVDGHLPMEFVPQVEKVNEGIDILIRDFLQDPDLGLPDWIDEIKLPGEEEIQTKVDTKIQDINTIQTDIKKLEEELSKTSAYKRLLYAHGSELEEIVEQTLSDLGLALKKPDVSNEEDRFFETKDNKKIYFEMRGVNRLMNEGDLAQLIKRLAEKPVSKIFKTRGVFVFNHQNKKRPLERDHAFHLNIETQAKSFGICLLDTMTLFDLIEAKLKGVPVSKFGVDLLNTIGIFKIEKKKD